MILQHINCFLYTSEPGELRGSFKQSAEIGKLLMKTETGIFGQMETSIDTSKAIPMAMKQEVTEGPAQIIDVYKRQVKTGYTSSIKYFFKNSCCFCDKSAGFNILIPFLSVSYTHLSTSARESFTSGLSFNAFSAVESACKANFNPFKSSRESIVESSFTTIT